MTTYYQKQLLGVQEAQSKKMELVDNISMRGVKSLRQAMALSIAISGNTHESIADHKEVNKRKEQITKFINGSSGLLGDDIENLINATGNLAIAQYLAKVYGFVLVDAKAYEAMKNDFISKLQAFENVA